MCWGILQTSIHAAAGSCVLAGNSLHCINEIHQGCQNRNNLSTSGSTLAITILLSWLLGKLHEQSEPDIKETGTQYDKTEERSGLHTRNREGSGQPLNRFQSQPERQETEGGAPAAPPAEWPNPGQGHLHSQVNQEELRRSEQRVVVRRIRGGRTPSLPRNSCSANRGEKE
jgi:hypothetical protein